MQIFTDQMGRTVRLDVFPPRRIVSLVPSQTELLYDLGLNDEVVGITKFCVHPPEWYQQKKRVGGTKTVFPEKVAALAPDLIIGNKEENDQAQIEGLAARYPVWMSDIHTLTDTYDMICKVGLLTRRAEQANILVRDIRQAFTDHAPSETAPRPRVAYFIWRKPYMVAGGDTFIDHMLENAGFENVFHDLPRYPEVRLEDLRQAQPDRIFLSSEPFPFAEKHFGPFLEVCPGVPVNVVDGEMFSWYGSRLLRAPGYFEGIRGMDG